MKKLLTVVLVLVVLLAVVGYAMPTSYRIDESIDIAAPPEEVHAWVGDLEKWPSWAPWEEEDPTIETTLGDKTTGVGASQTWTTAESGSGELEVTASDPRTGIAYDMAFIMDDVRAPASCEVSYAASDGTTTVTWSMEGDVSDVMPPVVAGLMKPLMSSEIRSMFQRGLQNLKREVESQG